MRTLLESPVTPMILGTLSLLLICLLWVWTETRASERRLKDWEGNLP